MLIFHVKPASAVAAWAAADVAATNQICFYKRRDEKFSHDPEAQKSPVELQLASPAVPAFTSGSDALPGSESAGLVCGDELVELCHRDRGWIGSL